MQEKMYSRPFSKAGVISSSEPSSSLVGAVVDEGTSRILKVVVKKDRMSRRSWTLTKTGTVKQEGVSRCAHVRS